MESVDQNTSVSRTSTKRTNEDARGSNFVRGPSDEGSYDVYVADGEVVLTENASRVITQSFHLHLDLEGSSWSGVLPETLSFYWEEFKKHGRWPSGLLEDAVQDAFLDRAAERYRNMTSNIRTGRVTWRPHENIMTAWEKDWEGDKQKQNYEQGKKNRRKGSLDNCATGTYTGGPLSFRENLTKAATYDAMEQATQQDNIQASEEGLYYASVDGHDPKNRVFGVGKMSTTMAHDKLSSKRRRRSTSSAAESYAASQPSAVQALKGDIIQMLREPIAQMILEEMQRLVGDCLPRREDGAYGDGNAPVS